MLMRILLLINSPNDLNHLAFIFEKVDFEKATADDNKSRQYYPAWKELSRI